LPSAAAAPGNAAAPVHEGRETEARAHDDPLAASRQSRCWGPPSNATGRIVGSPRLGCCWRTFRRRRRGPRESPSAGAGLLTAGAADGGRARRSPSWPEAAANGSSPAVPAPVGPTRLPGSGAGRAARRTRCCRPAAAFDASAGARRPRNGARPAPRSARRVATRRPWGSPIESDGLRGGICAAWVLSTHGFDGGGG